VVEPTAEKGRREKLSKAMGQTTGGRNLRVTMAIAAFAAVLLALTLAAVFQTALTTSDRGLSPANHAMSADGTGESRGPTMIHTSTVTPKWSLATTKRAFANRSDLE